EREEHIKRFLKNLKDYQVKVVLRKQRFKDLGSSRHRPKERAFVSLSEDEAGWESEGHVRFEDEAEEVGSPVELRQSNVEAQVDQAQKAKFSRHLPNGHACRARSYPYCDGCHQDKCKDFETMETMKNLARNGVLKGVPPDIDKKLLDGKADPGK
ncbi:hypothetical protein PHMEG_00024487, partial [Phytophthora megakarya]